MPGICIDALIENSLLIRWESWEREDKRIIIVQAAMPSAMLPIILAKHFDGDANVALQVVLSTSVLGLLTIPWWIQFGMRWVLGV